MGDGTNWLTRLMAGFAFALLAACGGSDDLAPPPPSEGSATIGATGGTVQGPDGVQLIVPAGALQADTTIRIARSSSGAPALPAELQGGTAVYEMTPHGLRFDVPATIRLPSSSAAGADGTVLLAEPGGGWQSVTPAAETGYLAIQRRSLSWYTHTSPWSIYTGCTPRTGDPYPCTFPTLRPEGEIDVTPPEAWPAPRGLSPEIGQPASLTWPVRITAPRDCAAPTLTVLRRVVPPATPVTAFIPYQEIDQRSIGLAAMPSDASRSTATTSYTAQVAAGDRHAIGLRFVFACTRTFNGNRYSAVLDAGYRAQVPSAPGLPTITQQPASVTVVEGNRAEFRVVATAPDTLAVNWQRSNDGGATWSIVQTSGVAYALAPVQTADDGARFRAQVCNALGTALNCVFSDGAVLTVVPATVAPTFTQQPQSIAVVAGQSASFTVVATATPAPTVRWFREAASGPATQVGPTCSGTSGPTACTYTTGAASVADDGARFFAMATNGVDNTTSAIATLAVTAAPVAPSIPSAEPGDVGVTEGGSATFSVNASGTAPLSYQWQRNGTNLTGANSASYTLANAQSADNGARFRVIVSNGAGSATSREAVLTVTAPPPPPSSGICTSSNPAGWCWARPAPHGNDLSALAFDGSAIQVVGSRTSMRSADAGATWATTFNALDVYWWDLAAPGNGVLLGATQRGFGADFGVYRSTDGGQSWVNVLNEETASVAFQNATQGVAVGRGIWRTTDGGTTWSVAQAPTSTVSLSRVTSPAPGGYVAIGSALNTPALIMRSVDGGQTWTLPVPNTNEFLADADIAFGTATTGLIVTGAGDVLRTTDGGATWHAAGTVTPNGVATVAFADANTAVAISAQGAVFRSINGGLSWAAGDDLGYQGVENLRQLRFRSSSEGYAVAMNGQVWRTADAGQTWALVAGGSDLASFYSVRFRYGDGLAAGLGGLYETQDNGGSWVQIDSAPVFHDVALLDNVVRVSVGYGGIRRSADRGQTWTTVTALASGQALYGLGFIPSTGLATTGVAVGTNGANGIMLRTTDSGLSWSPVGIGTVPPLWTVAFSDSNPNLGLAGGSQRALVRTTDGGASWNPVTVSALDPGDVIQAVRFTSTAAFIAADSGLYRSTDGGFTWTRVFWNERGSMLGVAFLSATDAVAVGVSGSIARSTDGGATWTRVDVPVTTTLRGVAFSGSGTGVVAVGEGGTILRNTQGGAP